MTSSERNPGAAAQSRFIPREELEGFATWRPHAFDDVPTHAAGVRAGTDDTAQRAVREQACSNCHLATTAGDECVEFANRTCPLSRFSAEVVTLIEALRRWQHHEQPK